MRLSTLYRRGLFFYWRTNLAVSLGAAAGTAALTGALLVGDSMRGSLREAAVGRLGRVDHALVAGTFFRERLAEEMASSEGFQARFVRIAPLISALASIAHAESQARANGISLLGVDDRFWQMQRLPPRAAGFSLRDRSASGAIPEYAVIARAQARGSDRSVILNETLAAEIGAQAGDSVIIRFPKPSDVSAETLLGRRGDTTATLRLRVHEVIPARDIGAFSLRPRQTTPNNAYVELSTLQRALDREGRVNTLLVQSRSPTSEATEEDSQSPAKALKSNVTAADLGVRIRHNQPLRYISIESEAMLLPPPVESAVQKVVGNTGAQSSRILTYLANRIAVEERNTAAPENGSADGQGEVPRRSIPYSTVTALDPTEPTYQSMTLIDGLSPPPLEGDGILLNARAAQNLGASVGEPIRLTYYVTGTFGRLETRNYDFVLRGIVALDGAAADPGLTPEYHGVTDAEKLAEWDPPFPMDLSAIRPEDEAYWDQHRATPKAFIGLQTGQQLWATESERFGDLTAVRIYPEPGVTLAQTGEDYERHLVEAVDLARMGLAFRPVRAEAIAASEGTTDFGMLFLGFSFFLIVSAAMVVALLFRLGVERRAGELGLLLSLGFGRQTVTRLLVMEGLGLAVVGAVLGLAASFGYAWLMLTGLRSVWSSAVHAPFVRLYVTPTTLGIGCLASIAVAAVSVAWSTRGRTKYAAHALLAGAVAAGRPVAGVKRKHVVRSAWVALFLIAVALLLLSSRSGTLSETIGFFLSGASLLLGCLALIYERLVAEPSSVITPEPKGAALTRLGVRNAQRHRGRSMLTAGLIASATFLIAALQAFYLDVGDPGASRQSGTGGFRLYAEATVPMLHDLNTKEGSDALAVSPEARQTLEDVAFVPFRLRPGDASSCVNLYRPDNPRILGATQAMIDRGGFTFAATMADTTAEKENSWTLLGRSFPDGAIPVIGDESAVRWQLHLALGDSLTITDQRGREARLRFVALLSQSMLQDELIVSEANFVKLFPPISGYAFFLIDVPAAVTDQVERTLETELQAYGFDVASAGERLRSYLAVQNTYLSTFQMLGGFGLILGTVGLAAVMLRNVWERRGELALMRAVGFSRQAIGWIVLAENITLLVAGLGAGVASALLAVAPHVATRPGTIPWLSLARILFGVLAVGILAGIAAIAATLRAPLIPALRRE